MCQRRTGIPRVATALVAVGCAIAGVSVAAAAEPRADQLVRATASNTWDKTALAIQTGDTVTWDLAGGSQAHNVQKDPVAPPSPDPSWNAYNTEYAASGRVDFTFTQPGTYDFVCGAHSNTMFGTIEVTGSPVEPTATPSATPTPTAEPTITPRPATTATPVPTVRPGDDRITPAPTGSARLDRTAPTISAFRLKAVRRGATVRFTLSEPAAVTIRVKRGSKTLRTARRSMRAGRRAVTVRGSRVVKGRRYSVEIEARDARGNRAPLARKTVRVTR